MSTDLTQATAAELGGLYAARKASPVETLTAVLARAERVNPLINALTLIDRDGALQSARESEARWMAGTPRSPLDGAPVSIKELIRTQGWPQTMGSLLTEKVPAVEDAPAVARLREAGAIVYAQNTSPEYGFKGVTDSPLNGITRNPWNLDRTPGGSSGGSGAAVAAGLGPIAIGTDGGGSVRIPASACGLVGMKATFGRVPAWPASMHGDLANTGPMTRTALDCALMMNVLSRPDARDPFGLPPDGVDYAAELKPLRPGLRVALIKRYSDHFLDPEVEAAVDRAAGHFRDMGCVVEEVTPPFDNLEAGRIWSLHWLSALQRLLQVYPESRHNEFDPGLLLQAQIGSRFTLQQLVDGMVTRRELCHAWNLFFERHELLISPTLAVLPFAVGQNLPIGSDGNSNVHWALTAVFNLTRHPAATVPCGVSADGLPIGLQVVSGLYRDALTLAACQALAEREPIIFPTL